MPSRAAVGAVVLTAALLSPSSRASAAPAGRDASADTPAVLTVPGGTAALAEAAGVDPTIPRARVLLTIVRALYEPADTLKGPAYDRRARFAAYLRRLSQSVQFGRAKGGDEVPIPLPESMWPLGPEPPQGQWVSPLERIFSSRTSALAYYGLCAMDQATRDFLVRSSEARRAVFDPQRAPVLAAYGRSLRVNGARIEVPGGQAAVPIWESLVGAPVTKPAAFIARVLEKDLGRLALLYDAVAHLEPPAQAFVLGLAEPDSAKRIAQFKALYQASAAALITWNPQVRPFDRAAFDAAQLLTQLILLPNGLPAGPGARGFWNAAFVDVGALEQPGRSTLVLAAGGAVDAAWLVEQVAVQSGAVRRARAETYAFAQRVFPAPSADSLPQVLAAARGYPRFPMLLLTLERMGLDSPATYAVAVRAADALAHGDRSRSWAAVAQFQAAIDIIERMRFARLADREAADALVRSLCELPLTPTGEYLGNLAPWLEALTARFPGAWPADTGLDRSDRPFETRVLALMAGASNSSPFGDPKRMPVIEWDVLPYRVDPATATLRRMLDVREVQGGPSLDAAVSLAAGLGALPRAADRAEAATRIAEAADALRVRPRDGPPARRPVPPNLGDLVQAMDRALADRPTEASVRASDWYADLCRAADWHLASMLTAIVYAPHVGPRGSQALLGGDPSLLHDLGGDETVTGELALVAWSAPAEVRDRSIGWHVRGSLLGVDLALGRFALRHVVVDEVPPAPRFTDLERFALTEPVLLISPFDQTDADRDALLAALARGRARLADARASGDGLLEVAAAAELDEWRAQALPWMAAHEPDHIVEFWSLAELVRLGSDGVSGTGAFDAFGSSMWSVRGQLACRFPWRQPWTSLAGRMGLRMAVGLVPDMAIATAEALAALKLPARLSAGLLAATTQELLVTIQVNHSDDWMALVSGVRSVSKHSFEAFVTALTGDGPLIAILQEPGHETRH